MKILRLNTVPFDPGAVFVATDAFPEIEFRVDLARCANKAAVLQELQRRIDEEAARRQTVVNPLIAEIKGLIEGGKP